MFVHNFLGLDCAHYAYSVKTYYIVTTGVCAQARQQIQVRSPASLRIGALPAAVVEVVTGTAHAFSREAARTQYTSIRFDRRNTHVSPTGTVHYTMMLCRSVDSSRGIRGRGDNLTNSCQDRVCACAQRTGASVTETTGETGRIITPNTEADSNTTKSYNALKYIENISISENSSCSKHGASAQGRG